MIKKKKNTGLIITSICLTICYITFLSFIKYKENSVSLVDYSFLYIGNILNITLFSALLFGFILLGISKKTTDKKRLIFLIVLQLFQVITLILIYLESTLINFESNSYLFSFPIKKIYVGLLFISGLFCHIYSLIYVWGIIIGSEKLYEIRTFLRTIVAVIILLIFSLFYVWNTSPFTENNLIDGSYEYAIIPGAAVWSKEKPSPIFEGRIRKALELNRKGKVDKLIVTGGNAPGEISEAEAAKRLLIKLGVDTSMIVIEEETSTTIEQVKFLKFDKEYQFHPMKIVVVSDGFHLTRILEICKFFNIDAVGISSDYSLSLEKTIFYRTRESIALLLFWFFAI